MMLLEEMVIEDMISCGYKPNVISHVEAYWKERLS